MLPMQRITLFTESTASNKRWSFYCLATVMTANYILMIIRINKEKYLIENMRFASDN